MFICIDAVGAAQQGADLGNSWAGRIERLTLGAKQIAGRGEDETIGHLPGEGGWEVPRKIVGLCLRPKMLHLCS